jgi:coenzyme Q-binding protein COQ10
VPQYASFLPYCLSSRVTHWSNTDPVLGKKWPERAELEVGWGAVKERFASRIYCVPGRVVEAVAGDGVTSVDASDIQHHAHGKQGLEESMSSDILTHLSTRWEVTPVGEGGNSTRVTLDIEVKFANPVYAAMSQVAAEKVADKMIEAFEARIQEEMKNGAVAKGQTG